MTFQPIHLPDGAAPPRPARPDGPIAARVLAGTDADSPTLVALHGISRDDRAIWRAFAPLARETGRALVVPRFRAADWPQFQRIGRARPDLALLSLFDSLEAQQGLNMGRVEIFGYSGGAQLAHRFAMLYPHRVAALHVAAPGWYCMPDEAATWPEGLAHGNTTSRFATLKRRQLANYLRLKLRLYVGAEDTARDPALRRNAALDARQGETRLDRAHAYLRAFRDAAGRRGITPDITLTLLPGCGHDFTECARTGGLSRHVMADPVRANRLFTQ